ncbi:MAG: BamA/TamA family outer membrane protein [Bacteroidetes bacterium]|nr:BamA/TamA family outer membrane protein [Bacteroidota bacterium]
MKDFTRLTYLLLFVCILFLAGCSSSHWLTEPGYLLNKTSLKTDHKDVDAGELENFIQQKPNKGFLRLYYSQWIYAKAGKGTQTKFKTWIKNKFGKPPVMLENRMTENSCRDMKAYLNNIGYFNSKVSSENTYRKKKAHVKYVINTGAPYILLNITWSIPDDTLKKFVYTEMGNTLVKPGDVFNVYTLDEERSRITRNLKNQGYYNFITDYITYELDTSLNAHSIDITAYIQNIRYRSPEYPDSVLELKHKRFIINNIYINPEFNTPFPDSVRRDTMEFIITKPDHNDTLSGYFFIHYGDFKIRPRVFTQSILFKKGDIYNFKDQTETNTQLSRLPVTRLATINFDELNTTGNTPGKDFGLLNCRINILRSPVNAFSVETDVTNSAGNPGVAGSFTFQNKNIFRGAEVFRIKLRGSAEIQKTAGSSTKKLGIFNTFETGIEFSLQFPRFLIPISQERFPKYFKPRTSIITGYGFEFWPKYERTLLNLSFGYNWEPQINNRHSFYPVEISSVKIKAFDSTFYSDLHKTHDLRLIEQYTDHLIMDMRYNYIFSSQKIKTTVDFIYLDVSGESGGNLLYTINRLTGASKNENGKYTILRIPFSQYLKGNIDLRYYHYLNQDNILVMRGYMGLGIPFGNSEALPFERAFFGGGANDQRGWQFMRLGPGSFYSDTLKDIDRMGDIKLMGNIEFRFPVYSFFHGALFADAGNIWQLHASEAFPSGQFKLDEFLSQMAVDAGIGFRFDFDFFIFRLDVASPVLDPSHTAGDRWIFNNKNVAHLVWNFAIGYPF